MDQIINQIKVEDFSEQCGPILKTLMIDLEERLVDPSHVPPRDDRLLPCQQRRHGGTDGERQPGGPTPGDIHRRQTRLGRGLAGGDLALDFIARRQGVAHSFEQGWHWRLRESPAWARAGTA